jgi:DMSO/TMAO reductase YedYZ molybdopterin-dependent catalytic subunit
VTQPSLTERPRLPLSVATFIGVVALGAALAVGQFAAAFVGANASPYVAVGDAVIKMTPGWLKEFAVKSFGTNDKLVLLGVMGVVLVGLAVLAGALSRRNPMPGMVLAIALGIAGVAAVLGESDLGQLGVVAPVASLAIGPWVFSALHRAAGRWIAARDAVTNVAGAELAGDNRRRFLLTTGGVVVGAGVAGIAGKVIADANNVEGSRAAVGKLVATNQVTVPVGADFASSGTPTYVTPVGDFYRIDTALTIPQLSTADWSLKIHGMVDREITFKYNDIRNRPLVEELVTLTCVSDPVGGPYISNARWIGVPIRDLLMAAGAHPDADQVLSTSVDGYTAGTPIDVLLDPNRGALLAIGMNGEPLPVEHGFPARMVVPGLYGYVSATKWVTDLELTTFAAKQGYWVPRGYSAKAPIKTEARIDKPAAFATVSAGQVVVAGIAWAQTKGIARVEVRVDGGRWQDAQLSTEVSKNTWRMWRAFLDLKPGGHSVQARATDQTGYVQTGDTADSIPDGATGWPSVSFSVH